MVSCILCRFALNACWEVSSELDHFWEGNEKHAERPTTIIDFSEEGVFRLGFKCAHRVPLVEQPLEN